MEIAATSDTTSKSPLSTSADVRQRDLERDEAREVERTQEDQKLANQDARLVNRAELRRAEDAAQIEVQESDEQAAVAAGADPESSDSSQVQNDPDRNPVGQNLDIFA